MRKEILYILGGIALMVGLAIWIRTEIGRDLAKHPEVSREDLRREIDDASEKIIHNILSTRAGGAKEKNRRIELAEERRNKQQTEKIDKMKRRIREILMPELDLESDIPLFSIASTIQEKARKADETSLSPPINILVAKGSGGEDFRQRRVTIPPLPRLALDELLLILVNQVGGAYVVSEEYIEIVPADPRSKEE